MKVFVVLFVLVQIALPEGRPFNCWYTKYKIFCRDSRLRSLPQGRPKTMLVSMKGDILGTLNQSVISKSGLGNLTTLELINTNINVIQFHTFLEMRELESLTISYNYLTDLQPGACFGLNKLIKLDLTLNKLTKIDSGVFEGLNALRFLNLALNYIIEIHAGIFDGLRRDCSYGVADTLSTIDLSYNKILNVNEKAFRGLCSLKSLKIDVCHNRELASLTAYFNSVSSLRRLEIDRHCPITPTMEITMRALHNLKYLKISDSYLPKIKKYFLEDSKSLKKLSIVHCGVQELELGCFQGLQSLSELDLSDNKIRSLNEGVFQDLQSLQKLDLVQNSLNAIDSNLFRGLTHLKYLDLRLNQILSLKRNAFSNLPSLRKLWIYTSPPIIDTGVYETGYWNKIIQSVDLDAFSGLFSLKRLDIPFCSQRDSTNVTLESLDRLDSYIGPEHFAAKNIQVINNLQFLTWGDLISSDIDRWYRQIMYLKRSVTLAISDMNSLEELKLISGFPIYNILIRNCKKCTIRNNTFIGFSELLLFLHISSASEIKIDQGAFSTFKNLLQLRLYTQSEKGFRFAPGVFQELGTLRKLVLEGNDLSTEEGLVLTRDLLKGLKNIKELYLLNLRIPSLGDGIFHEFQNIEILDLSYNRILSLDNAQLKGLRKLKTLKIWHNIVSNLSVGAFDGLETIQTIYMDSNKIESIGEGVFGAICPENFTLTCANLTRLDIYCNISFALGTLKELQISRNSIKFIHKHAFLGCNSLKILDLTENQLQTVDFLFTPQLKALEFLGNGNVSEISNNTFSCTPMLAKISLKDTNVHFMHVNALKHLKYLEKISLPEMNYDCRLHQIWLWLRNKNIYYYHYHDYSNKLAKLECNSSIDDINHPRNESSIADEYIYFKMYIEPIVFIFIFLSGCFGNGLLLFVVFRHSDMRKRNNSCVAHLAIADILSLVLNLPLSYWDVLHVNWDLGETTCKIFITSKNLLVALVVFSVVALTLERYLVVQSFNKLRSPHGNSARPIVFLVIVWMYALVTSIPSYFHATVEGRCLSSPHGRHGYFQRERTFQFFNNCILPVVSIIFLNILSAYTLKKSIRKVPGIIRNQSHHANRNTVANIAMVLSLVFTLSSLPNFLLRTLVSWSVWTFEEVFWYSFVTYCLFFFHTIFNPFALFVMGSKYKSHIKDYITFFIKEREHVSTPPDVKKELENVCDVLQNFGQTLAGTHEEEHVEELDDVAAKDEAVRRERQERLKKLQAKFL